MADSSSKNKPKSTADQTASTAPTNKVTRRVKNPETFRERAVKAAEASDKPKKTAKVRTVTAKPFKATARGLRKIFDRQPFITIGIVFRVIGKLVFPAYFRNSFKELRLVTWPGWKLSRQLTFAVLAFAIVFGGAIALVDYGLDKVFRHILLK